MNKLSVLLVGLLTLGGGLFGVHHALAATLYLSPTAENLTVGQAFTVTVYTSSTDQALNGYSGTLSFPTNLVEVTGIATEGITDLWPRDPAYSNTDGSMSFEGLVLNPGFTGSGGKVVTFSLKAKAVGTAPIVFTQSEVLANDGKGTNILTNVGNASYVIAAASTATPPPTTTPPSSKPAVKPPTTSPSPSTSPTPPPAVPNTAPVLVPSPSPTLPTPTSPLHNETPQSTLSKITLATLYPIAVILLAAMVIILSILLFQRIKSTKQR